MKTRLFLGLLLAMIVGISLWMHWGVSRREAFLNDASVNGWFVNTTNNHEAYLRATGILKQNLVLDAYTDTSTGRTPDVVLKSRIETAFLTGDYRFGGNSREQFAALGFRTLDGKPIR